jgi:hypothetical protein
MEKTMTDKDEDYVDIPVSQQEFTFTYINSEDLNE